MDSQEKKGIQETLDVITGTAEIVRDLAEHLSDDGKISSFEWAQTAMENAPTIMKMVNGFGEVDDELKDLDQDELKLLAGEALNLVKDVWKLVQDAGPKGE